MERGLQIRGSLLGRNTLLNFIGQAVPLVVGIITVPVIVHGLGTERFGLLSLIWVALGYFQILDLGLGRATAKFAAEALSKGQDEEVPHLVITAALGQAVFGAVGGAFFAYMIPLLTEGLLNIPKELNEEATVTFRILAFVIPIVLVSGSFRGLLEAAQRFDLISGIQVILGILTYISPLLGVLAGIGLPGIVILILLVRFGTLVAYIMLDIRLFFNKRPHFSFDLFFQLFRYGFWITLTLTVNPFLIYLDRIFIASLLSMEDLAYYTVPVEIVTRLQIIPASLTMTLFTAFSALEAGRNREKLEDVFTRSVRYILLALGLFNIMVVLFGPDILHAWLGPDFAQESGVILQIASLGILVNSLAYVPSSLLSGAGRPDIPAKFHLLELPAYAGILWLFARQWGITGVAWAWTLRILLDALLLFKASFKTYNFSWRASATIGMRMINAGLLVIFCLIMAYVLRFALQGSNSARILASLIFALFFCWFSWNRILDALDRRVLLQSLLLRSQIQK